MVYNPDWSVLMPENKDIYVEERNGVHHYIALVDNINIGDMFKCIDETINYNKDLERKLILFKEKTKELQDIFSKEEYDKLKTLEFRFPPQKKTKKTTKKKTEIKVNETNSVSVTEEKENTTVTEKEVDEQPTQTEEVVHMKEGEYMEELERK